MRLKLVDANQNAAVTGASELPGKSNYFVGNDPHKWRTNVPNYARVKYEGVYPGVDLVFYGNQRQLEHDFVIAPGGDTSQIRLRLEGSKKMSLDGEGNLDIAVEGGEVRLQKPLIYQEGSGRRREIAGGYVLKGTREVAFKVGAYDPTKSLVIDPTLAYSTYLGGSSSDGGNGIAVDSSRDAYVTGYATSDNFPTTADAFQIAKEFCSVCSNAFITKLNPNGSALVYSTFLGGDGDDIGRGIAVDSWGNASVTGSTTSGDFPTTTGAFRFSRYPYDTQNAFVAKLAITTQAQIVDLERSVQALVSTGTLSPGLGQSLLAPLNATMAAVAHGNDETAIGELNTFITRVQSMVSGGVLLSTEGSFLIGAANSIITAL